MIKTHNRIKYAALVPVFVIATFVAQFANVQPANAATLVWDGSAGDNLFGTAANWNTNAIPVNGDVLNFDISTANGYVNLTNDITNLSVAGITYTGTGTDEGFVLLGNEITLTGNITSTATNNSISMPLILATDVTLGANVSLQGARIAGNGKTLNTQNFSINMSGDCIALPGLIGSGTITSSGARASIGANGSTYTGNIIVTAGTLYAQVGSLGTSAGSTTVQGSGNLSLYAAADSTWSEPFVLGGTGTVSVQHDSANGCNGAQYYNVLTGTFTGPVTLNTNFIFSGRDNMTVAGTYNANGHTFTTASGASGTLTTPQGTSVAPTEEATYADQQPSQDVTIGANQTGVINGARQDVAVTTAGTVKGTGDIQTLAVNNGIVAPGVDVGVLTVAQQLTISDSTYQAQLRSAAAGDYDQITVGSAAQTTGTSVVIEDGSVLEVSLLNGYSITQGDTFMIINNLQPATQAVNGTFAGLAEGAQFTVNGIVFNITYVGGDGNDVVLTALNTGTDPSVPNTGVMTAGANPVLITGLGVVAAATLAAVAMRRRTNS